MNTLQKIDQINVQQSELYNQIIDLWFQEVLFTWRWWVGVALTFFSWLFWIVYHKKESRYRLLNAGFFVMTASLILDSLGVQLGLWSYRFEVIPFILAYLPYNLALMPVVVMSLIQFKPHFSPLIKSIVFGVLTAYVGEPLVYFLKVYNPYNWQYFFSVPIYMLIYLIANWLTTREAYGTIKWY
ncbi:hypothetical protein FZC76_12830 [Sutcliffiella horikoshii]|uniref:Uncharacterized protein n=1 Tax=Sutcliffiella horikoshii TaxID=79883 RepID=A0A5D4SVK4_9BACI|nr:CBO0543 family protein [Sutcliffiella horikoshii]TYS67467.1 hypothetical protein FZC76_12830 [Sutcliffiella horikoshii]